MTSFIIVTDRASRSPIILNADEILAIWTALDVSSETETVVGSNIFMLTPHGTGGEGIEPRICVIEPPSTIAQAILRAGLTVGIAVGADE